MRERERERERDAPDTEGRDQDAEDLSPVYGTEQLRVRRQRRRVRPVTA
jgi:hypothetical protein